RAVPPRAWPRAGSVIGCDTDVYTARREASAPWQPPAEECPSMLLRSCRPPVRLAEHARGVPVPAGAAEQRRDRNGRPREEHEEEGHRQRAGEAIRLELHPHVHRQGMWVVGDDERRPELAECANPRERDPRRDAWPREWQ